MSIGRLKGRIRKADVIQAIKNLFVDRAQFEPRKGSSKAEVRAPAESDVRVGVAGDIKVMRMSKNIFIAIRCRVMHHHL